MSNQHSRDSWFGRFVSRVLWRCFKVIRYRDLVAAIELVDDEDKGAAWNVLYQMDERVWR